MAKLFRITPGIRRLASNAIDTMIDELGKDCLLVFDGPETECPNCGYDPTMKASVGEYNGTGPRPFSRPPCPVCRGRGLLPGGEIFKEVRMLIDWQPKPWNFVDTTGIKVPQGLVQTKGYVSFMDSVIQAKYLIIDHKNARFSNNRFVSWGEVVPSGNIVPSRYFVAFWTRG